MTTPEKHQVHCPQAHGLGCACLRSRGSESVGQLEIEQCHGEPRRQQEEVGVRSKVGFQGEQRPAHGGVHIGVDLPGQPLRQPTADPRWIQFAQGGAAKLAEKRVCQSGHQRAAAVLYGDQVHLFGIFEVAAAHQVAQHIDRERLALRQDVDHHCDIGCEATQLAADQVADAG